jgi:hypothetical protein
MIRIKVFSNFCNDENIQRLFQGNFLTEQSYKHKFMFVTDDTYTHAIIVNVAMPILNIPKENVLGLCNEPIPHLGLSDNFIEYAKRNIGIYLWGGWDGLVLEKPFIKHYSFMLFMHERKNYFSNSLYPKIGKMAIWCSFKKQAPGHQYRHTLIERILKTDLDIDIWGNGCGFYSYSNDKRIKGEHNDDCPYKNYEYCISIENYVTDDYISEKFLNCIAGNTVPIYLGARNVAKYFGENCYIKLTGDIDTDMKIIKNVKKIDLTAARKSLFEGDADLETFLIKHWKL